MTTGSLPHVHLTYGEALVMAQRFRCDVDDETRDEAYRRLARWYEDFPEPFHKGSLKNLRDALADPDFADDLRYTMKMKVQEDCHIFLNTPMSDTRVNRVIRSLSFWSALVFEFTTNDADRIIKSLEMSPEFQHRHEMS